VQHASDGTASPTQLGIIPGFGGTQRLPRLVGLQKAAEMMLTSKPISEKAALAAGLVDEVVPKDKCALGADLKEQAAQAPYFLQPDRVPEVAGRAAGSLY